MKKKTNKKEEKLFNLSQFVKDSNFPTGANSHFQEANPITNKYYIGTLSGRDRKIVK